MVKARRIKDARIDYLVVFLLVIISDACYWFESSGDQFFNIIRFVFLFIFPFFVLFRYKPKLNKKGIATVGIMSAIVVLSAFMNNGKIKGGDITLIFTLLSACLVANSFDKDYFFSIYRNIVLGLTCYSLLLWFFVAIGIVTPYSVYNIASAHLKSFGGLLFNGDGFLTRNSSLFREPGVYSFFLCRDRKSVV